MIIFSSYMNVAIYFQECYFVELIIACRWAIKSCHLICNKVIPIVLTVFLNLQYSFVNLSLLKSFIASLHVLRRLVLFPSMSFFDFSHSVLRWDTWFHFGVHFTFCFTLAVQLWYTVVKELMLTKMNLDEWKIHSKWEAYLKLSQVF